MSPPSAAATLLGFDYGEQRIGVAVGQTITRTATPLKTLTARAGQPNWSEIESLLKTWQPNRVVIGLPETTDGGPHSLAEAVRRFGRRLHGRFGLVVEYIDERLSSHEAAARCRGTSQGLDAMAACLILETWLDETHPRDGSCP